MARICHESIERARLVTAEYRLNPRVSIRPFVTAGVLPASLLIHWNKDRASNPDASERPNDLHHTCAETEEATP